MDDNLRLLKIKNNLIQNLENAIKEHEKLNKLLILAKEENNEDEIEKCERKESELSQRINCYKSHIEYMRPNNEDDLKQRSQIMREFPKLIHDIIPDGVAIVFHGKKEIGIAHEIINSGGLKTPDELNVGYSSFATQIDVTNKYDIHVSCEFADPGSSTFMPYGVIFVFYPLQDEISKVLKHSGSEVTGGVKGIDFKRESDRFIGVITTSENKIRMIEWFLENGLDTNKVFTHEEFLEMCRKQFIDNNYLLNEESKMHR